MTEHTRGPWKIGRHQYDDILEEEHGIYPPFGESGPVAIVSGEANARLIREAPRLLELARQVVLERETNQHIPQDIYEAAAAIIAAVRGEGQ